MKKWLPIVLTIDCETVCYIRRMGDTNDCSHIDLQFNVSIILQTAWSRTYTKESSEATRAATPHTMITASVNFEPVPPLVSGFSIVVAILQRHAQAQFPWGPGFRGVA